MRKFITVAVAVLVCLSAGAATPKKKKKTETDAQPAVTLATPSDTLSYAGGVAGTIGLIPYLQQQYGVDTTFMADFIAGYKDALQHSEDPRYKAWHAGVQIADMVERRILPAMGKEFEGSPLALKKEFFDAGFIAGVAGDTTLYKPDNAETLFKHRAKAVKDQREAAYKKENDDWLAENAKKPGVVTTASGLQYRVITQGTGEKPGAADNVTVKYEGKTIDGTVFDSSYKRNPQTNTFRANQVIKGWTEALELMPAGSKYELFIPSELGYGGNPAGRIKPYSTLIFTVELVSVEHEKPHATDQGAKDQVAKPATTKVVKSASKRKR